MHSSLREYPNGPENRRFFPLCCVHIFTTCNIIARPIIVLCDAAYRNEDGRSLRQQKIGGIYLPMLRDPSECEKSPIVLGYSRGNFMPLISSEDIDVPLCSSRPSDEAQHCIPLVRYDQSKLPVHFLLPHETTDEKIHTYLEVCNIPCSDAPGAGTTPIPAALFKFRAPLAWSIQMMWSLMKVADEMYARLNLNAENKPPVSQSKAPNNSMSQSKPPHDRIEPPNNFPRNALINTENIYKSIPPIKRIESPDNSHRSAPPNNEKIYESMLPCSRHVLGCQNFAGDNAQGMCRKCYLEFIDKKSKVPVRPARKDSSSRVQAFHNEAYQHSLISSKPIIPSAVPVSSSHGQNIYPNLVDHQAMYRPQVINDPRIPNNPQNPGISPGLLRSNSPAPPTSPRLIPHALDNSDPLSNWNAAVLPSFEFEKRLLKKCINESCNGDGIAALDNKCRDCYVVSVHERTKSSLVSEPGRPYSEPASQRTNQDRNQDQSGSPQHNFIKVKTMCAEPGCNFPPTKDDLCELHSNKPTRAVTMCISCDLRVVDHEESQLCNTCLDQQMSHINRLNENAPQNRLNENAPPNLPNNIDAPPRGQFSHDNNSLLSTSGLLSQDRPNHPQTYQGYPIDAYKPERQHEAQTLFELSNASTVSGGSNSENCPRPEQCNMCYDNYASKDGLCNRCWDARELLQSQDQLYYRGPAPHIGSENHMTLCMEGCGRPAVPANNGLCHDCYEKVLSKEKCMITPEAKVCVLSFCYSYKYSNTSKKGRLIVSFSLL